MLASMSGLPAPTDPVDDVYSLWSNNNWKSFDNLDENSSSFLVDDADKELLNADNSKSLAPTNDHCAGDLCVQDEQLPVLIDSFDYDHLLLPSSINNLETSFDDIEEFLVSLDNPVFEPTNDGCANDFHLHEENNHDNYNTMFVSAPGDCGGGLRIDEDNNNNSNNIFTPPPPPPPPPSVCGSDLRLHNECNNDEGVFSSMFGVGLHNEDEGNNNNGDGHCESGLRLPNEDNNENNITSEIIIEDLVDFAEPQIRSPNPMNQSIEFYGSLQDIPQKRRRKRTKAQNRSWVSCTDSLPLEEEHGSEHQRKRKRKSKSESGKKRECSHCATTETPQWRNGPKGKGTLCNACGVRFKSGKLYPEYRPAASPTFDGSRHSNFLKKISRMKSKVSLPPRKLCIRPNQFQRSSVDGLNPVALVGLEQGCKDSNLREDSSGVIHQVHMHVGYPVYRIGDGSNENQNMHNF